MATDGTDPRVLAALEAANLYYLQDLTMDAIASELQTSRSSVSRLLSFARETGLVEITVRSPLDHGSHLEHEIRRRFGVAAHIVRVPDAISEVDRLERVAITAGRVIPSFIDSNMKVGIAWRAKFRIPWPSTQRMASRGITSCSSRQRRRG